MTLMPRPWVRAIAARSRALLEAAEGDLDGAMTTIERALANHDALPMPLERARSELVAGRIARRRKERRRAGVHLDRAVEQLAAVGAKAWLAIAEAERARLGRRTATARGPHADRGARRAPGSPGADQPRGGRGGVPHAQERRGGPRPASTSSSGSGRERSSARGSRGSTRVMAPGNPRFGRPHRRPSVAGDGHVAPQPARHPVRRPRRLQRGHDRRPDLDRRGDRHPAAARRLADRAGGGHHAHPRRRPPPRRRAPTSPVTWTSVAALCTCHVWGRRPATSRPCSWSPGLRPRRRAGAPSSEALPTTTTPAPTTVQGWG